MEPRDLLHGSFLRFDKKLNGRVDVDGVRSICQELGVRMDDRELAAFTTWFDTNGSDSLDYNELVRQLYGDDVMTRSLKLPKLGALSETKQQLFDALQKSAPHREPDTLYDGHNGVSMTSTMALGLGSTTKSHDWIGETTYQPHSSSSPIKQPKLKREGTLKIATLGRNLVDIESPATKEKKKGIRQKIIMEEKTIIQNKLASIDRQRKKLLEDYRNSHHTTTTVWI